MAITGAGAGIGRAYAFACAEAGARVVATDPTKNSGNAKALTELEPVGQIAVRGGIARTALWPCSDSASFITGHPLAADGGFVAR